MPTRSSMRHAPAVDKLLLAVGVVGAVDLGLRIVDDPVSDVTREPRAARRVLQKFADDVDPITPMFEARNFTHDRPDNTARLTRPLQAVLHLLADLRLYLLRHRTVGRRRHGRRPIG